jgi:hypothetical protein
MAKRKVVTVEPPTETQTEETPKVVPVVNPLKQLEAYSRPRHAKILAPGEAEALVALLLKSGVKARVIRLPYGIYIKCPQFEVAGQA